MPRKAHLNSAVPARTLDCRGLLCPLPILEAAKALRSLSAPFVLDILSDDPAARQDFAAFAKKRKLQLRVRARTGYQQFTLTV